MRIWLVAEAGEGLAEARELAAGLRGAGHDAEVLVLGQPDGRIGTLLDRALARRGFTTPLAGIPLLVAEIRRARPDVVHAFSMPAAEAALIARRSGGAGAIVFTSVIPVTRDRLADRRLRLRQTRRACDEADALTAADRACQAALWRWMALRVPVIELGDAERYAALYRTLV